MKNISIALANKDYQNRQHLFLQDPKSDLFVVLKEKIYPLHKAFLIDVKYFSNPDIQQEKVHMLNSKIQAKEFESIMGYFYGKALEFSRSWGLEKLIEALEILQIPILLKKLYADIKNNFDDYGFFLLVEIAYVMKLKWLRQLCEEELALMNFQQLNYNRYDLFQVNRETLEEILKLHELLRINQNIPGQNNKILRQIVSQYCKTNQISESEVDNMLQYEQSTMDDIREDVNNNETIRKRNNSEPQNFRQREERQQLMKSMSTEAQLAVNDQTAGFEDETSSQLYKLKVINSEINQKGNKLLEEISKVKEEIIYTGEGEKANQLDGIEEKFKKFEKMCHEQDEKYLNLKKEMERMNHNNKKSSSSEKQKEREKGIKGSVSPGAHKDSKAAESTRTMFSEIPKLSRD